MNKRYKLFLDGEKVGTIDTRKGHGDVIEFDGRKVFVFYTKGNCVFGGTEGKGCVD